MKKTISASILIFVLLLLTPLINPLFAKKWVVNVKNYSFTPYNLTHVRGGDTIQWVWVEGTHTTTSLSIPEGAGAWYNPLTQDNPSFIYVPQVNGTYYYQCTPHTQSGMNGSFLVTGSSGYEALNDRSHPAVFPNPFREYITIGLGQGASRIACLRIYNSAGKLIRVLNFSKQAGTPSRSIDLHDLPTGVFFIEIHDESNKTWVQRVVHE